jgi:hypothetical protein
VRLLGVAMIVAVIAGAAGRANASPCSRSAVASELRALGGYELDAIEDRVRVMIDGDAATVTFVAAGDVVGARAVHARTCKELSRSIALVIVMSLRDLGSVEDSGMRGLLAPVMDVPAPSLPTSEPIIARARGLEGRLSLGVAGDTTRRGALVIGAGVRVRGWSLALELRDASAQTVDAGGGSAIVVDRTTIDALPCLHLGRAAVCGLASTGIVRGEGRDLATAATARRLALAVGGRAELAYPLWRRVAVRVHADVLQNLIRSRFLVDQMPMWTADSRELWLGAGVVANFP